jgi:L-Ala-D/L-Glu epimerase
MREVRFRRVDWEFKQVFRVAYRARTHAQTVQLELQENDLEGRGEALGVVYHGETVDSMLDQLAAIERELRSGVSRADVQKLLPAGGARNAVDCALWDLEAKRERRRVWELAGVPSVQPLTTAFTLGVDEPAAMIRSAASMNRYSLLKLKLTGEDDLARVAGVRAARPDADIIVDANQAWCEQQLREFAPALAELGVKLIEQPLPAGKDAILSTYRSPVPLCADESCQTIESLPTLVGRYQYVNIKLDKTGGLTEALRLAEAAAAAGLKLMVGCNAGSSLSMAPAFVVGQSCDVVDLDGPLLSRNDMANPIRYVGSQMHAPEAALWG